jgi:ankyrin repeat protein
MSKPRAPRVLRPAVVEKIRGELQIIESSGAESSRWQNVISIVQRYGKEAALFADAKGQTALHFAAEFGKLRYCELLLHRGANANARTTRHGHTPMHRCAGIHSGDAEIAKKLIQYGAEVNAKDAYRETPLFGAARFGHVELMRVLIAHGADVNARGIDDSVLCHAVMGGNLRCVQALVEAGASIDPCPNNLRYHPELLARLPNRTEIYRYLVGRRSKSGARTR